MSDAARRQVTREDYERAERFLPWHIESLIFDGHVEWWGVSDFADEVNRKPGRLWCDPVTPNGM